MNIFMVALPFKIYIGLTLMIVFITSTGVYISGIMQNLLKGITGIFI